MKLGMILPIQSLGCDLAQLWEELREEVAEAESAGFDAVFLPEFHQAHGGALVSPLLLGAGLLQGTSRRSASARPCWPRRCTTRCGWPRT